MHRASDVIVEPKVNNRQATALSVAVYLMLVGMVAHGKYFYESVSRDAVHGQATTKVSSDQRRGSGTWGQPGPDSQRESIRH
jgi:hypothetical protein